MTQIDRVAYEELTSFGNYQNACIRAEATLQDGEDPSTALVDLRGFVCAELDKVRALHTSRDDRERATYQLDADIAQRKHEIERLTRRAQELKAVLERHGVETPDLLALELEDLPF